MSPEDLEELVVSTMQETQVKLGSASGSEVLYLPLSSIDPKEDPEMIGKVLDGFRAGCRSRLGDVECEILDQRVRITVPESGNLYVSKLPVSPVLRLMVRAVSEHMGVEDLRAELDRDFPGHVWKDVDGDGFEHIVYFEDGSDPNVYCIGRECCQLVYHRFSRRDYLAFGFGDLRRGHHPVYNGPFHSPPHEAHHLHRKGRSR